VNSVSALRVIGAAVDEFPLEIAGRIALSKQAADRALDTGGHGRRVAVLEFRGEFLEARLDLGDVLLASLPALGGVGRAVGEDPAAGNIGLVRWIGEGVAEHREFIMLQRQGRIGFAASLLFAGEKRRIVPGESRLVLVVKGAVVLPGDGAEDGMAVASQAGGVGDGEGAAIGNEQHLVGQRQVIVEQIDLLLNGGAAVVIAVENGTEHRDRAEVVDGGSLPGQCHDSSDVDEPKRWESLEEWFGGASPS